VSCTASAFRETVHLGKLRAEPIVEEVCDEIWTIHFLFLNNTIDTF
jgi:hypothetical protein